MFFFFFKQKTAYEIVSRDWSSDVCSSDLEQKVREALSEISHIATLPEITMQIINLVEDATSTDRKSVV